MPRDYSIREHRLVEEWVTAQYPRPTYVGYRVRLGAFDPTLQDVRLSESELRRLGVRRRWADAIVVDSSMVQLIEGKLTARPGAIEQLQLYATLFPLTPELEAYRHLPVILHLVWGVRDPVVEGIARSLGIQVHYFHPTWVDAYFAQLRPREVTPPGLTGTALAAMDAESNGGESTP